MACEMPLRMAAERGKGIMPSMRFGIASLGNTVAA